MDEATQNGDESYIKINENTEEIQTQPVEVRRKTKRNNQSSNKSTKTYDTRRKKARTRKLEDQKESRKG